MDYVCIVLHAKKDSALGMWPKKEAQHIREEYQNPCTRITIGLDALSTKPRLRIKMDIEIA